MGRAELVGAGLRDVPVLAEKASHVAAGGAHREYPGSGEEMIERFFLDGIDLQCRWRGIAQGVKFATLVGANETESGLAFADVAVARAEVAVGFVAGLWFPPAGFVQRGGFLEDFQVGHGAFVSASLLISYDGVRAMRPLHAV